MRRQKYKNAASVKGVTLLVPGCLRSICVAATFQKELATQYALKRDAADQARKEAMEKEAAARKKAVTMHTTKLVTPKLLLWASWQYAFGH